MLATGQLAVIQVANMAYGIDLGGQKVLWKFNLMEGNNGFQPGVVVNQVWPDNEGVLQVMGFNQMTQAQVQMRIGYVAAVQWDMVLVPFALNLLYLSVALWFFNFMHLSSKRSGQFAKLGT